MKRLLIGLLIAAVPVAGFFAAQVMQPARFADRTACLYLSEDSLALRNVCDEPVSARLCLGDEGGPLRCRYLALAPDEKSPPAIDLAAGKVRPAAVRYGACRAPFVPSTASDPNNASLTRFGCRTEGSDQQEQIPASDFRALQ